MTFDEAIVHIMSIGPETRLMDSLPAIQALAARVQSLSLVVNMHDQLIGKLFDIVDPEPPRGGLVIP